MKKLLLLLALLLANFNINMSQPVVVSEIFYAAGSANEWTELLVVEDNVSLVGYTMRDNSGSNGWMGGIRFNDVELWRNLRIGTIIVINHRGGNFDDEKSDGYIEMGSQSSFYFTTFKADGTDGPLEYTQDGTPLSSLDLNSSYDMIQIRDVLGNHVHCLGYIGGQIGDNYDTIPKPNIFLNSGISQNNSVKVSPGLMLSNYLAGLSPANISGTGSVTKGLPNKRSNDDHQNHAFWRELRQPDWTNPGIINTRIVDNFSSVELTWNAASTYSDPDEGYMILRYIENNNIEPIIEDGKIYNVGQILGIYKVVGIVPRLTTNQFLDDFSDGESFECGKRYAYRIYAFRYGPSFFDPVQYDFADPRNARGRQYNEASFASVAQSIIKEIPPEPQISTTIGVTQFCSNVEAKLEANIKDTQKYFYQWYSNQDGELAGDGFTLDLTKPGDYWLVITSKSSGCASSSNEIKIEILEAPETFIIDPVTSRTFSKDTTIYLCAGNDLNLRGLSIPSGSNIESRWEKDGAMLSGLNDVSISEEGIYKFIAESGGLCPDTSIAVTVKIVAPDFTLSTNRLEFDADSDFEKDIILTNNSNDELVLNQSDIIITPANNFKLISPAVFPVRIPAKGSYTIRIKFEIVGFGSRDGRITISTLCNLSKFTDLFGQRPNLGSTRLDADKSNINLGNRASLCPDYDYTIDSIRFIASGTEEIYVIKPTLNNADFTFVSSEFATDDVIRIKPGEYFSGFFVLENYNVGTYSGELTVKYVPVGRTDTSSTKVTVEAVVYDPEITLLTKMIDVSNEVTCKRTLDTFLILQNNTIETATIEGIFGDARITFLTDMPREIEPGVTDTIYIRLNFTNSNPFTITFMYENPCQIGMDLTVIPPAVELDVSLQDNNVDFGVINNCVTKGDVIIDSKILASAEGAFIGRMIYNGTFVRSNLFKDKIFNIGDNLFEIRIPETSEGIISDSIVFEVEPCGEIYTLYIKGERINPLSPQFSTIIVDFGQGNLLDADTRILTVVNLNAGLYAVIDSIQIPAPFVLVSPNATDFPVEIPPSGTFEITISYPRSNVGSHNLLANVYINKPCPEKFEFIIRGSTIDNRMAMIKAKLPESEIIEIGSEKRLPVNFEFDPNYSISELELRNIAFHLSFDHINLNLRTALLGQALNSPTSLITFDDSREGKLILTLNISEPEMVNNGELILITAKPLLGDALNAKITLDSVIISSRMPTSVETNESDITIIGDCDLEGRLLAVAGNFGITVRETGNLESLNIYFSNISDENTEIKVYNNLGELADTIISGHVKPGDHVINYDVSGLPSGVYSFILTNGIRYDSITYPVVK
ncbi:MAG: hypothetical protein KIT33_06605 [Candidatus Kapabacteria bacterium]|nr:hypothetical protein [Ignavibacteriota bacterium]MCW5884625.1 hypothetical protein [Candidatus Kapabacteria bacterium]